jgi:leucyl/phenylalanyl-tRNA--protein transferase
MPILKFPDVSTADENGLLALGGDLSIPSLIMAYEQGIFPWPISNQYPLAWFSPDPRGILEFKNLHLSRSLKKLLKHTSWHVSFNQDFRSVISNCAKVSRPNQGATWITPELLNAYCDLHKEGMAYSVEVWDEQELIGGLYGVRIRNFVSGESMFHLKDNASKVALYALMKKLELENIHWIDTQMCTSVVTSFGAEEIPRDIYLKKLKMALEVGGRF